MKVIIAGGRDYRFTKRDYAFLDDLFEKHWKVTEIVSGGARGADQGGENYAVSRGIKLSVFPAQWDLHGRAAGPIRNKEMAEYADAAVVFPGGRGSRNMIDTAKKLDLQVCEVKVKKI